MDADDKDGSKLRKSVKLAIEILGPLVCVLQRVAVFGSVLQRVAACCNVFQYLAMAPCHTATYGVTLFATQDKLQDKLQHKLQHKLHWHRYKLATEALKSAVCMYIYVNI